MTIRSRRFATGSAASVRYDALVANRRTKLGRAYRRDPESARRLLRTAIEKYGGNATKAAKALDVSTDQFYRYVSRLDLRATLEEARSATV